MFGLVSAAGEAMVANILQIVLGSILAVPVYYLGLGKHKGQKYSLAWDIVMMTGTAALGTVLPLGTFGVIPILAAMLSVGIRYYIVLPLILSNAIFNMLVPFTDPGFIWSTGYMRVLLAFMLGILAGIALRVSGVSESSLMRKDMLLEVGKRPVHLSDAISNAGRCINIAGLYLVVGILLNTVFHKFGFWSIQNFLTTNPHTASIPRFFAGQDVVNPFFMLAISIAYVLMDFVKLSAMSIIIRPKGLVMFIVFSMSWIVLLGTSAFI